MSTFRKKPVVIDAVQWDGTLSEARRLCSVLGLSTLGMTSHEGRNECSYWKIGTLEGGHEVRSGDWIITGVKGEHYPCKPDIFALTYEPADQPAPQGVWRCFHCGELFTDQVSAQEHFGTSERQSPACEIDVKEYRSMEERMHRYNEEDSDMHRQLYRMESEHQQALRREEEKGYARGLVDRSDLPAPQGVAEVMELVRGYAIACLRANRDGGYDDRDAFWKEAMSALTALVQERDEWKFQRDSIVVRMQEQDTQIKKLSSEAHQWWSALQESVQHVADLEQQASIGTAVQNAASKLPGGYGLRIELERGSGWLELTDTRGNKIELPDDSSEPFGSQIETAIECAIAAAKELHGEYARSE